MKKALMILSFLTLSVVAGFVIAFQYMDYKGISYAQEPRNAEDISANKLQEFTIHIEDLTTNLQGNSSYISLSLSILTTSKKSAEEISLREFQIKDFIIKELSSITSDEMKTQEGTKLLLDKVKNYANEISGEDLVLEVYITNKLIK